MYGRGYEEFAKKVIKFKNMHVKICDNFVTANGIRKEISDLENKNIETRSVLWDNIDNINDKDWHYEEAVDMMDEMFGLNLDSCVSPREFNGVIEDYVQKNYEGWMEIPEDGGRKFYNKEYCLYDDNHDDVLSLINSVLDIIRFFYK